MDEHKVDTIAVTGRIVSAFVGNSNLRATELPALIAAVQHCIASIASPEPGPANPSRQPAVPIKKSITRDYLICLEDGQKRKTLRRHLGSLGMTPEQYRAKWGLPHDYPMVCPAYAAQRSTLAKAMKFGSARRQAKLQSEQAAGVEAAAPEGAAGSAGAGVAKRPRRAAKSAS